jgi:N-acylneuraminate cytidylyltransferase
MYTLGDENRLEPVLDRDEEITRWQDAPETYVINGAVYVARTTWLQNEKTFKTDITLAYPIPKHLAVDIDTEIDLILARELINKDNK